MKVLLFGKSGQVATEIIRRAGATEIEAHGRDSADFTDPAACAALVEATDAEAVINAVAYTAVDKAEAEPELAQMINATTPGAIARAAARRDLPVVQISTDYVFDGSGNAPWSVDAPSGPLGVYGASKRAGERALREAGGPYAILRTSWVFSAHGANFVKTMLRLGAERDGLKIVADQIGGPTPAAAIADACLAIARGLAADPSRSGSYHFSGAPDTSWAGFARAIFEDAGLTCAVTEIPSTDYPTPARRPLNSRLDCSLTESVFGIIRPDWRAGLGDVLDELGAKV